MAKTLKNRKNDKKSKCMDTKCKLFLEEAHTNLKKLETSMEKSLKEEKQKLAKLCSRTPALNKSASKKDLNECEILKNKIAYKEKFLKELEDSRTSGKGDTIELASCEKHFCNEGCINSILEDGPANKLSKGFAKIFKNNKELIKIMTKRRTDIFKNKSSVLKDSFYEGLKPKTLKKLKKEGAISGCFIKE